MISPEMLLLLPRWYELEGEGVLAWIRGRKEWRASEVFKAEILTILDGFERDSERGFELLLGLKERSGDSDADSFSPDYVYIGDHDEMILYQLGRWGENPIVMFERFDPKGELREVFVKSIMPDPEGVRKSIYGSFPGAGFPETPADWSQYSSNSEMEIFARGLLDSGRGELARQLLPDLEGGARDAFDEVLGEQAAESGWREVKRQIDQAGLAATWDRSFEILSKMAQENREEALAWFVELDQGGQVSREERIGYAVSSGGAFEVSLLLSDDPFAKKTRHDRDAAKSWLDAMAGQGEPVREARLTQHREAIRREDWEWVRRDRDFLSAADWSEFEDLVVSSAVKLKSESMRGAEISWASVDERSSWVEAAGEFALLERVHAVADERNRKARAQLRAIVEEVEEATGR